MILHTSFLYGAVLILLILISTILAAIAWTRSIGFSLPLSPSIPALGTFLPLFTLGVAILRARTRQSRYEPLFHALSQLLTLFPGVLGTLAMTYLLPSEILNCRLETQWQRFFHNKDAGAIRQIQDQLRCCGLRSIHDRAWPFKDASHGDDACEVRFGYDRACLGPWTEREQSAAMMVFVAAVFTLMVKLFFEYGYPSWTRQQSWTERTEQSRPRALESTPYTDNDQLERGENTETGEGVWNDS
ncbi:hypothetical protein ASPZODRAFT_23523 [Penicilliopsis zonata CBS 506.65]|uniref:Tetraspanin Tsp3 n=1 Tax=Penicilliopsis zonata CBS 506.65 TaxID=1073090 RepID=A0A1L9SQB4_9EURO|nr:hypothetical protein ASPZODRAFT_23523 [Penicilliopsis zonata CBS 506.65]OJJ49271.1 hypothetical protein ASPZODRAFT_23523 [Penicilliopsis zonata CBS 506.65]